MLHLTLLWQRHPRDAGGMQIFKGGDASAPTDYNGPREADGIVSYLQKQSGPASVELTSKADVPAFVQKEVAVLGVFADAKSTEFKTFSAAADAARDEYDFGHVFDSSFLDGEAEPQVIPHLLIVGPGHQEVATASSGQLASMSDDLSTTEGLGQGIKKPAVVMAIVSLRSVAFARYHSV